MVIPLGYTQQIPTIYIYKGLIIKLPPSQVAPTIFLMNHEGLVDDDFILQKNMGGNSFQGEPSRGTFFFWGGGGQVYAWGTRRFNCQGNASCPPQSYPPQE